MKYNLRNNNADALQNPELKVFSNLFTNWKTNIYFVKKYSIARVIVKISALT